MLLALISALSKFSIQLFLFVVPGTELLHTSENLETSPVVRSCADVACAELYLGTRTSTEQITVAGVLLEFYKTHSLHLTKTIGENLNCLT